MNNIFEIYYSWYEDYDPILFFGPENTTEEEFQNLCTSLFPEATKLAIEKEDSWIGFREIIQALATLLENRGFVLCTPKKFGVFGTSIIRAKDITYEGHEKDFELLGDTLTLVDKHNKEIEDECDHQLCLYNLNKEMDDTKFFLDTPKEANDGKPTFIFPDDLNDTKHFTDDGGTDEKNV